jgi:hypothetical protein
LALSVGSRAQIEGNRLNLRLASATERSQQARRQSVVPLSADSGTLEGQIKPLNGAARERDQHGFVGTDSLLLGVSLGKKSIVTAICLSTAASPASALEAEASAGR